MANTQQLNQFTQDIILRLCPHYKQRIALGRHENQNADFGAISVRERSCLKVNRHDLF